MKNYSSVCSVDSLIGKIYDTSAIGAVTSAFKGGENPMRNLNLLRVYARAFESNGYKTLSDFISYIDKLIENETELPGAASDSGSQNGVRVLSVHASKGLEYPVCFLADAAKRFNKTDLRSDVLIDNSAGLGIKKETVCADTTRFPALPLKLKFRRTKRRRNFAYYMLLLQEQKKS